LKAVNETALARSTLTPPDLALVMTKHHGNRLGFAVLLAFFRNQGRFPRTASEIDQLFVAEIAQQLAIAAPSGFAPGLTGRTAERHRAEIRALAGFREASVADAALLEHWLRDQVAAVGAVPDQLVAHLETRCRALSIEPPAADRIDRIVRAAIHAHDERFCAGVLDRLGPAARDRLEALLRPAGNELEDPPSAQSGGMVPALLLWLRGDPGKPSLASVQDALAKLELIRGIGLPANLFDWVLPHELERYRRRVAAEAPYELRRHPEAARLTWLSAFGYLHARTLTDDLVDLLIETIHHIGARAERRVDRELLDDLKRVSGKQNLLFELAGAALGQPDGIVRDVVFPVVGEQTLRDLVKEAKSTGPSYRTTLRTVIRNSYKGHYRRVVPDILQRLEFRSNNARHRPIIEALDLQAEMREALHILDAGMPRNRRVRIDRKRGKDAWITVTPFDPQPEAPNLTAVKTETVATWPMTSLLDMLKEADLRLNFTDALKSTTAYETLDRAVLRPRLLLCLNGLGTKAGFQRMSGLQSGTTAKDLAYVRRRYVIAIRIAEVGWKADL
jgi:Domain of unknown function (DUF4158)/Tn3 transposase DDE domain